MPTFQLNILILIITSVLSFNTASGQYNWVLKNSKDNINVYTSEVKGSGFKAFKAVTRIQNTDLNEVACIITDVKNFERLIPDSKNCQILNKYNDGHIIHYLLTKVQWPFEDRDGVYELRANYLSEADKVVINVTCINSKLPVNKGVVRMNQGSGKWELDVINKKEVEVTYQYHANPGGQLPSWLVNSLIVSTPHKTLLNLKSIVSSEKYKGIEKLDFMK